MPAKFSRVRTSRRATTTSGVRRGFAAVALTAGIAGFAALGMAGLVSSPAGAAGVPQGNNGTVKIAQVGDVDNVPNNQPHQGCVFTVQWYNFDKAASANVSFTLQAPTPGSVTVGGDTTPSFSGGKGLNHVEAYTLTPDASVTPQPQQGYHVTLTVTTTASKGHSITKHKTFWFAGCGTTPTSESTSAAPCANPTATETVTATVTATVTVQPNARAEVDPCIATETTTVTETVTATASTQGGGVPGGDSPSLPTTGPTEGESVSTPAATPTPKPGNVVPTRIESGLVSLPTAGSQQGFDRWPLFALSGLSALLGAIGLLPRRRTARRS